MTYRRHSARASDGGRYLRFRLSFLLLSAATLLTIGYVVTGSVAFVLRDFWFSSGLLLLILLSLVDQPHFSKDADIFLNGIAALISLVAIQDPKWRTPLWWLFVIWSVYLTASAYATMMLRRRHLSGEPAWLQVASRFNRKVGRPEAIFSALFLWGVIEQFGMDAPAFRSLLLFWAVFMILDLRSLSGTLAEMLARNVTTASDDHVGKVVALVSPRVLDCVLDPSTPLLAAGTPVAIRTSDGLAGDAVVIDDRVLLGERRARLTLTEEGPSWPSVARDTGAGGTVVKLARADAHRRQRIWSVWWLRALT